MILARKRSTLAFFSSSQDIHRVTYELVPKEEKAMAVFKRLHGYYAFQRNSPQNSVVLHLL